MEKYFASHIYEEDQNGIPFEHFVAETPEQRWNNPLRWTTAASVNGARKNIRAKIKDVLGYNWKQVQDVNMAFGPVKKETYLGIYNMPTTINKEENTMQNSKANVKTAQQVSNEVLCRIINERPNEEKHLFAEIFHILHASGVYMEESQDFAGQVLVCKGENAVNLQVNSAIDFGRQVYTEVGDPEFIDEQNASAIRARLTALFKPAKQETTVKKSDTVVNEEEKMNNPYNSLMVDPENLVLDVKLNHNGKQFVVKRKIMVIRDGMCRGYVYHSNGSYLGHWYWNNTKYSRPVFTSKQEIAKDNKLAYEYAIKKVLQKIGIYCKHVPESAIS